MARREDAGGFFYSLGIDTDKGSFARAGEAINGLVNTAKAAAIAIGAALTIKGTVKEAMEDLNWANKLGIGTYGLNTSTPVSAWWPTTMPIWKIPARSSGRRK